MIELKNNHLVVQFNAVGGSLASIKDSDGIEYLWQGDPTFWSGQAPVLFPICGSLRDDTAIFDGQHKGHIARHGLVRKKLFTYEKLSDTCIAFSITSDEEMIAQYPYRFELTIVYTLDNKTIRTAYHIKNLETDKTMPYFIGGHPGFNCPLLANEAYTDYYLAFEHEETCTVPRQFPDTGLLDLQDRHAFLTQQKCLALDFDLFSFDAVTLDQLQSRSVTLQSKNHAKGIKIDFQDFPYLVIWTTTNKGPFIALEPWSGLSTSLEETDQFEDKKGVTFVKAGAVSQKLFDITIL